MCVTKNDELLKELIFQDGMFDHVDVMQHLIFIAEKISQDCMADEDLADTKSAVINLEALVKATAYTAIMHHHLQESRIGGAKCA